MAEPIPLFVELCAGTAALSLRLARGGARPPVSRMGAKTGYSDSILSRLGLHPGQGARAYLWCEPDPGCRLLLASYRDRQLAEAAAAVIRSWADRDPRELWNELRAEGPAKCPPADPREVARALLLRRWSFSERGPEAGYGGPGCEVRTTRATWTTEARDQSLGCERTAERLVDTTIDPREVARAALVDAWSCGRPSSSPRWAGPDVRPCGKISAISLESLSRRVEDTATTIDPREVARAARLMSANRLINLDPVTWRNTGKGGTTHGGAEFCTQIEPLAAGFEALPREGAPRLDDLPAIPAAIVDDARHLEPADLPAGSWVYLDPPYQNTTGYAHDDLGRAAVVELARRWRDAGAHVCISEAEPIAALVAEGWYTCEITHERCGQKRTFSKQQREHLTMSRPPCGQIGLFV